MQSYLHQTRCLFRGFCGRLRGHLRGRLRGRHLLQTTALLATFVALTCLGTWGWFGEAVRAADAPQPPPVYVPWVQTAPTPPLTPTVRGELLLGEEPFAGATVAIHACTEGAPVPLFSLTSDDEGQLVAPWPEGLGTDPAQPISLTLTFTATAPITVATSSTQSVSALARYTSHCLPSGAYPQVQLPAINLQAPVFITPTLGDIHDMPIRFDWLPRSQQAQDESLRLHGAVKFDCGACSPVEVLSLPLAPDATSIEWCAIAPHNGAADVLWGDFSLIVAHPTGTGETFARRIQVGVTLRACPPLPEP